MATEDDLALPELRLSKQNPQLEITIAKTGSKLLLWAFVVWATQLGAIFAFIKILIK